MIAYKLINFDIEIRMAKFWLAMNESCVTRAKFSYLPPQIFRPSPGTVLVVKRRRSSVCRLAPEGSTLLYVCMHMYLCMYVYVPMYVVCTWRVHKGALSHECLLGENIISDLQYIRIYFRPSAKTIFIANTRGEAKTPN